MEVEDAEDAKPIVDKAFVIFTSFMQEKAIREFMAEKGSTNGDTK